MKILTIEAELLAPLLAGARRTASGEFITSKNYIPGSVVRAAFAREIVSACAASLTETERQKAWVQYRDEASCAKCQWAAYCRAFEQLKFSNWYIDGGLPAPFSLHKCKDDDRHNVFDTLLDTLKNSDQRQKCKQCSGRIERAGGYYVNTDNRIELRKPKQRLITRAAIDKYRKTSAESALYSLRPLTGGQKFRGEIIMPDDCEINQLPEKNIAIGAKTSSGFGAVILSAEHRDAKLPRAKTRVKQCNDTIKRADRTVVVITCHSDAELPVTLQSAVSDTFSIKQLLQELLPDAPCELQPELTMVDYRASGGYGYFNKQSEQPKLYQTRPGKLYMSMGSVISFSVAKTDTDKSFWDWIQKIEDNGIGENALNGYGAVAICDEIHFGGSK